MSQSMEIILPGATIGVIGGGATSRLVYSAANSLGYRVRTLSAEGAIAAASLARGSQVVTVTGEHVSADWLDAAARFAPVRPRAAAIRISQDRVRERQWLEERGAWMGRWQVAHSAEELAAAARDFGGSCYAKLRHRVREGIGPQIVRGEREAQVVWDALGGLPCVVEEVLAIEAELSVVVARAPSGAMESYPPVLSYREGTMLSWSVLPAPIPIQLREKATALATFLATRLGAEGLLAVELFFLADGRLLVNELVPAPHVTADGAEMACATSQHEQLIRAICNMPLGATRVLRPTASAPITAGLLGDRGLSFDSALSIPEVRIQLADPSREAGPRKVVGHLSAAAETPDEALRRVIAARDALTTHGRGPLRGLFPQSRDLEDERVRRAGARLSRLFNGGDGTDRSWVTTLAID